MSHNYSYSDLKLINNKITQHTKIIEELKRNKEELEKLTDEQKIAEILHQTLCKHDCDWYYHTWQSYNLGNEKSYYLKKANNILKIHSINSITEFINTITQ